jgi:putative endonuclease
MNAREYYWIYMLEMENGALYTGYTNNITRRYQQHRTGQNGAKFTRSFKPVKIAQCWQLFESKSIALRIESFIKAQDRKTKLHLVEHPDLLSTMFYQKKNVLPVLVPVALHLLE